MKISRAAFNWMKTNKRERTLWEVWTYDVWGNAKDGFEVNDRYCQARKHLIVCTVNQWNTGTENEFESAEPGNTQIRQALGLTGMNDGIDVDGDDMSVYVSNIRTGRPLGELLCVSHESLSPIRRKVRPCEIY